MKTNTLILTTLLCGAAFLGGCTTPETDTVAVDTTPVTTTTTDATTADTTTDMTDTSETGAETMSACMDNIHTNGLRIITSPDYAPYEFINEQNDIDGFEIELVKAIAAQMGVEAEITGQAFDGLIPSLLAGRADMIAAGMTVTDERKKSVDFSNPFSNEHNLILAAANSDVTDEASLNGKTVAVQTGTVQEIIASGIEGAEVKNYELYTDAALALNNGQVDAMIVDASAGEKYINQFPNIHETAQLAEQAKAFAISKECPELTTELNSALATLEASGQLNEIKGKWFTQ